MFFPLWFTLNPENADMEEITGEHGPAGQTVTYDFEGMLEKLTGVSGWEETDGPDSGCGVDYWYRAEGGLSAYANVDQSSVSLSVTDADGDPLESASFDAEDPESEYAAFVTSAPISPEAPAPRF